MRFFAVRFLVFPALLIILAPQPSWSGDAEIEMMKQEIEFLKERLAIDAIAKAGFQRSSWASLFPALVDTSAAFFTDDPIFAYRTTGLDTNLVSGIPTVQLLSKGLSTAQAASRAIVNPDLQWSQGQQRAANTLIPLQNAIGIRNALNKLVEMQPKYSTME